MPFTHITLAQLRSQLATLLGDPNMSFYTSAELTTYIREALTTWGCASLYYRGRDSFSTMSEEPFYDLAAELDSLILTTKDRDIASSVLYSLIEPQIVNWLVWPGTEQFSLSAIRDSIQRTCEQFLLETGMFMYVIELPNLLGEVSVINFPESALDIRRVVTINPEDNVRILSKEDEATLQAYFPDWNLSPVAKPDYWTIITQPSLSIRLAPPCNDIARVQLLVVPHANTLDFEVGQILGIPEAFTWVIKYGVLLDLLGPHTQAKDLPRAKYCELRFREGIELAKLYPSVLNAEINGKQINISSLWDLDNYDWDWQNQTGVPVQMGVAGWNLIALSPVPATSDNSITLDYVKNPILPSADSDSIQIDKNYIRMLLEYCRHLALFKVGGTEFLESKQGYDALIQAASLHNSRLKAQAKLFSSLFDNVSVEKLHRPFTQEDEEEKVA